MFTKILHNKKDLFIFFSRLFVGTLQLALLSYNVELPVDINSISVGSGLYQGTMNSLNLLILSLSGITEEISAMEKFQARDFFYLKMTGKGNLDSGRGGGGDFKNFNFSQNSWPSIILGIWVGRWGGGGGNGGFPAILYIRKPNIDKWGGGGGDGKGKKKF